MTDDVLVLGGEGMLGHKMFQRLKQRFPSTRCTIRGVRAGGLLEGIDLFKGDAVIENVDVLDDRGLHAILARLRPTVVVNCIGVIKQRPEAHDAIPSIAINALLPHRLAEWAAPWGGRVFHFSTDCVFSGRTGHYSEDDFSDAEDLYGRTKYLGEVAAPNAVTLRSSIIGRELVEHRSLLDWFLFQQAPVVRGFRRALFTGITTIEMADVVARLIARAPGLSGLYQVAAEPVTKFELLGLIRAAYGLDVEIEPSDGETCDRSLKGEKFRQATGWSAPPWPEMIRTMAADPTPYAEWGVTPAAMRVRESHNVQR